MTILDDYDLEELEQLAVDAASNRSLELWLTWVLPGYVRAAEPAGTVAEAEALFGDHHRTFWAWLRRIEAGTRPDPFVGVWPRGGAKSTSAELGVVALGATGRRRYVLYVCETQDQADDHVSTIGDMLESAGIERFYPAMGQRLVNKFGSSKGWRRNRLRTASGFTVDAIGLDSAARGVKLDEDRPDAVVFDDIDAHEDSPKTVARKIRAITKTLIPAGSDDCAFLVIQNLVHRDGVVARLVDGRADFLARRHVSGPIPAVRGLRTEHVDDGTPGGRDVIVDGEPSWAGQDLEACQGLIDDAGLVAFLEEAQHDVGARTGALWARAQLARRTSPCPFDELARVVVSVDPSGGDGPDNDAQGIVVVGVDGQRRPWALDDVTCTLPPEGWARTAILAWLEWDADAIVAETNYGGDMVRATVSAVAQRMLDDGVLDRLPRLEVVTASRGKRVRAEPVAALYGRPDDPATWSTARAHHVPGLIELEDEMTSWDPDMASWSPNRVDALVWGVSFLLGLSKGGSKRRRRSVAA